jgi:hypothetical protein
VYFAVNLIHISSLLPSRLVIGTDGDRNRLISSRALRLFMLVSIVTKLLLASSYPSVHKYQHPSPCTVTFGIGNFCENLPRNLTFRGPCIVIYSYNKTNEMH